LAIDSRPGLSASLISDNKDQSLLLMKLFYIIAIALVVLLFLAIPLLKKNYQSEKFKQTLQIIALLFCMLAVIAIFISYYLSGDKTHLYRLSLPVLIGIITIEQFRRNKKSGSK